MNDDSSLTGLDTSATQRKIHAFSQRLSCLRGRYTDSLSYLWLFHLVEHIEYRIIKFLLAGEIEAMVAIDQSATLLTLTLVSVQNC